MEYSLISFVKTLEFISATVVRRAAHDAIRARLSSSRALNPDAAFLDDLTRLVDNQRIFRKDSEALKLTIETCCDAKELAFHAPPKLKSLRSITEESDAKARKAALGELADCLSATRNELSHAKSNYQSTGAECPAAERTQLAECARLAVDQAIRWFGSLSPHARVTTSV